MEETKKRGRGRPKKEKTEPTKKEIAKEHNTEIEKANEQLDIVAQKFVADPTPFFAEREKEIAEVIAKTFETAFGRQEKSGDFLELARMIKNDLDQL